MFGTKSTVAYQTWLFYQLFLYLYFFILKFSFTYVSKYKNQSLVFLIFLNFANVLKISMEKLLEY